jgi:hypothetical protein
MILYLIGFIAFYFGFKVYATRIEKEDWTPKMRAVTLALAFGSWLAIGIAALIFVIAEYSSINDERVAKW